MRIVHSLAGVVARGRLWFCTAALTAVIGILTAEPAAALTCQPPDPWFVREISLPDSPTLPPGVFASVTPRQGRPNANQPPWDSTALNWLQIENTTSQPLYVLEDADEYQQQMGYAAVSWPDENLGDVPAGLRTRIKLLDSTWYSWPTNCAVVKCESIAWMPASGSFMITDGLVGLSRGFQDRIPRNKNRPGSAAVPAPQSGKLTLAYAGRAFTLPFVVTYELNASYDPANGTDNCGSGLIGVAGALVLLISAGIALPTFALLRFIRRRARAHT